MRLFKPIITALSLAIVATAFGQKGLSDEDGMTLSDYTESYPTCITQEVIYDGCTLMLNSDGEYLFGQFNILHPELQMRILMQGMTFFVDPTGKKKEKYAIHFPAASAVEDVMSQMTPPEPSTDVDENILPDIKPLIAALSNVGVEYEINNKTQFFHKNWASINLDDSTHCLSYTFIIPVERMLSEKKLSNNWKLGLYSEGGRPTNGGPGMGGPGMGGPGMGGPGMGGPGKSNSRMRPERDHREGNSNSEVDLRKMMMNDIEVWVPFSFENICALDQNNSND